MARREKPNNGKTPGSRQEHRSRIAINRVYTRTGDKGTTGLVDGSRVPKDSLRIEAYGTVDELNATVGLVRSCVLAGNLPKKAVATLDSTLLTIQNELFDLGSELATPPEMFQEIQDKARATGQASMPAVTRESIRAMEKLMDRCTAQLEPLRSFVLPGGGMTSAFLHLSRTVCRRAERLAIRLAREETVRPEAIQYLNRLSDLLFVLSRWVSHQAKEPEVLWQLPPR